MHSTRTIICGLVISLGAATGAIIDVGAAAAGPIETEVAAPIAGVGTRCSPGQEHDRGGVTEIGDALVIVREQPSATVELSGAPAASGGEALAPVMAPSTTVTPRPPEPSTPVVAVLGPMLTGGAMPSFGGRSR